jgi:hypothetical protein
LNGRRREGSAGTLQSLLQPCEFACELCDERPGVSHCPSTTKALESMTQLDHMEGIHSSTTGCKDMCRVFEGCGIVRVERQLQAGDMARGILEEGLSKAREESGLLLVSKSVQRYQRWHL